MRLAPEEHGNRSTQRWQDGKRYSAIRATTFELENRMVLVRVPVAGDGLRLMEVHDLGYVDAGVVATMFKIGERRLIHEYEVFKATALERLEYDTAFLKAHGIDLNDHVVIEL